MNLTLPFLLNCDTCLATLQLMVFMTIGFDSTSCHAVTKIMKAHYVIMSKIVSKSQCVPDSNFGYKNLRHPFAQFSIPDLTQI